MSKLISALKLGTKIEIEFSNNKYTSQVTDIMNKDNYMILGPIKYGKNVKIPVGKKIKVRYFVKDKGRFWFQAVVKKVFKSKIYKLHIMKSSESIKLQDREFYRLKKIMEVNIYKNNNSKIQALTENISGNGMKIITDEKFTIGQSFPLELLLNCDKIEILGKIVRIESNTKLKKNVYGVLFHKIDQVSRDRIIKYIFDEQRKLRKKGLRW